MTTITINADPGDPTTPSLLRRVAEALEDVVKASPSRESGAETIRKPVSRTRVARLVPVSDEERSRVSDLDRKRARDVASEKGMIQS